MKWREFMKGFGLVSIVIGVMALSIWLRFLINTTATRLSKPKETRANQRKLE